ncbi:MAG: putative bifunctional diguanylate cyclase/phosphodiesterase [Armatimonadota bacterium]
MCEFLRQQLDYVFFLYGLSFVVMAVVCFTHKKPSVPHLPWVWLGLFGVSHGLVEFLEIPGFSMGDVTWLAAVRLVLRLTSFTFLIEFGRAGLVAVRSKGPGRWVLLPFFAISALGGLAGEVGLDILSRYALAFVGGVWSAAALLLGARQADKKTSRSLTMAGVMLLLYAITSGIIGPKAAFFPASIINRDVFSHLFGLPIEIIRGVTAAGTAVFIWIYCLVNREEPRRVIQYRIGICAAVVILTILAGGWIAAVDTGKSAGREFRSNLLVRTLSVASTITCDRVTHLSGNSDDVLKSDYRYLRTRLQAILMMNGDSKHVYLLGLRDGQVVLLLDANRNGSSGHSTLRYIYGKVSSQLKESLSTGKQFVQGPMTNQQDTWITSIVSLRDPETDQVVALLGEDVGTADYFSHVGGRRLHAIIITLLLCLLAMAVAVMLHNAQESHTAMASSEARYRSLIEGSPDCIIAFDRESRCLAINERSFMTFGRGKAGVIGLRFSDLWPDDLRQSVDYAIEQVLCGTRFSLEAYLVDPDGTRSEWRLALYPIPGQDDKGWHFVAICTDVTELKRAEADLRVQASAIDAASNQILITDPVGRIEFVNPAFEHETGYRREEVIGQTPRLLKSGKHTQQFYEEMWNTILAGETWHGEITNRRKDGGFCIDDVRITPVKNERKVIKHFVAIKSNITDNKLYEKRLDYLAHHDSLTGLPNRVLFTDRLTLSLAQSEHRQQMLALMFLDLDRFKLVNDTMGHSMGDALLKTIAARLPVVLRNADTVARMGGDEFIIILPEVASIDNVSMVAQRVLDSLSEPLSLEGQEFLVTASIGISLYPVDGVDAETLLKNAYNAMYKAKEYGGNTYYYYEEAINTATVQQMKLQNSLRKAVEREEFVLHYQPVTDIETGTILGAEALVRWHHPELGLLSPSQFIALAEKTDLIVPITEWVLHTACAQNMSWQDEGFFPMAIAVNISARIFERENLSRLVRKVLEETGLDPHRLVLELTESILMQDSNATAAVLGELRFLGVRIAIDDFGTGYSSLSYLKRLPIDSLKIDRSFIKDITVDLDDAAIAGAIIAMAHSLRLKVIAEGVETTDQLEFLRSLKCDEMQGYLSSKPVPSDEFSRLLQYQFTYIPKEIVYAV